MASRTPLIGFLRVLVTVPIVLACAVVGLYLLLLGWSTLMRMSWVSDRTRQLSKQGNPYFCKIAGTRLGMLYFNLSALHHVGRRSGRAYVTPLSAYPLGDGFVLAVAYPYVDWRENVLAPGRQCPFLGLGAWCPPRDPPHTDRMPQVPPARYLLRAKDLVDARYAEAITVDDMAAAAALSRAHFSRMFARTFGESPRSYLQSRRLERAAALLRYTDRSVADICLMVGLQSVGSFTSSFARVYGLPPAAYRASVPAASVHARVPSCVLRRDTRPIPEGRANTAHGEKTGDTRRP